MIGKRTDIGFTPQCIATDVRLLWDRTLVVPISITSTEAASGVFEASLVELRGQLRAKSMDRYGIVTLQLYDSAQSVRATLHISSAPGSGTKIVVQVPYGFGPRSIDLVRSLRRHLSHST